MLLWVLLLLPLPAWVWSSVVTTTPRWRHSVWLADEMTSPRLYWASQDKYLYLLIEANTIGSIWLQLDSLDAVVLWVDDATGEPHVQDYHMVNGSAVLDEDANYDLIGGNQNNTHTSVAFRRLWNTCDSSDVVLGGDTLRISWSMHAHDTGVSISNDVSLMDDGSTDDGDGPDSVMSGQRSLLLQTPLSPPALHHSNLHSWDVLMRNVKIQENMSTQYWCKIFRSPSLARKNHIVAYEPLMLSPSESMVHHLLMYECSAPAGYLDSYTTPQHPGAPCYSPDMPADWETCVTPVATWVLGGGPKVLPEHVGIPLGPRQTYYMLEVHYDNPGLKKGLDNSGFRIFHTEDVRSFDAGVFQTGVMVTPLHLVPPQQPDYLSAGLCNDVCTNKMLPEKGVKVVSVLLHSHVAGRASRVRHIRGDRELPHIVEDNKFDFAYQQDRMLRDEVTLFPGDKLVTECQYNTLKRKTTTFGGYSTRDEMCLSFITYYPRTDLASCLSMAPVFHVFSALGIKGFYGRTMDQVERFVLRTGPLPKLNKTETSTAMPKFESDAAAIEALQKMAEFVEDTPSSSEDSLLRLLIKEPDEFKDRDLSQHLQGLPWTDSVFTNSFQKSLARDLQMVFCRTRTDSLAVPLDIDNYPVFTELEPKTTDECATADPLSPHTVSAATRLPIASTLLMCLSLYICICAML